MAWHLQAVSLSQHQEAGWALVSPSPKAITTNMPICLQYCVDVSHLLLSPLLSALVDLCIFNSLIVILVRGWDKNRNKWMCSVCHVSWKVPDSLKTFIKCILWTSGNARIEEGPRHTAKRKRRRERGHPRPL
jgi:hypothetical protein